jgi:hypothetical protein
MTVARDQVLAPWRGATAAEVSVVRQAGPRRAAQPGRRRPSAAQAVAWQSGRRGW